MAQPSARDAAKGESHFANNIRAFLAVRRQGISSRVNEDE
jgi:hypothetical protein